MNLLILPLMAICCVGYLIIPIAYVGLCIWIARKDKNDTPPVKAIGYAIIVIGAWWLALVFGSRPFDSFNLFIAVLIPNVIVSLIMLAHMTNSRRYRRLALLSGALYPLALGFLYLLPTDLTDQEFPILQGTIRQELIPGTYIMHPDTAVEMARQGYTDKSATITLYDNKTFTISRIPHTWIDAGQLSDAYDSFSGAWNVQNWQGSKNEVLVLTIDKLDPSSAWGPQSMGYSEIKKDGTYSFAINLTRRRGNTETYALAIPIMQMDDQGYLLFVRR